MKLSVNININQCNVQLCGLQFRACVYLVISMQTGVINALTVALYCVKTSTDGYTPKGGKLKIGHVGTCRNPLSSFSPFQTFESNQLSFYLFSKNSQWNVMGDILGFKLSKFISEWFCRTNTFLISFTHTQPQFQLKNMKCKKINVNILFISIYVEVILWFSL